MWILILISVQTERLKKKQDEEAYFDPQKSLEAKEKGNAEFKAMNYPEAVKVLLLISCLQ